MIIKFEVSDTKALRILTSALKKHGGSTIQEVTENSVTVTACLDGVVNFLLNPTLVPGRINSILEAIRNDEEKVAIRNSTVIGFLFSILSCNDWKSISEIKGAIKLMYLRLKENHEEIGLFSNVRKTVAELRHVNAQETQF